MPNKGWKNKLFISMHKNSRIQVILGYETARWYTKNHCFAKVDLSVGHVIILQITTASIFHPITMHLPIHNLKNASVVSTFVDIYILSIPSFSLVKIHSCKEEHI